MLKRFAVTFSVLGLFVLASLAGGASTDKPTIKQVMGKLHNKKAGLLPSVQKGLNASTVEWKALETKTKEMVTLSESIEDAEPPKGEKADYEKLAKIYTVNAKALAEAVGSEDVAKSKAAARKIGTSCKSCHDAHK